MRLRIAALLLSAALAEPSVGGDEPSQPPGPVATDLTAKLRDRLAACRSTDERDQTADAFARSGSKDDLAALVELFTSARDVDFDVHAVGIVLNGVMGRLAYVGEAWPRGGDGNLDEAVPLVREWWSWSRDRLRFVATTRAWVEGDAAPLVPTGVTPPDTLAAMNSILADVAGRNGHVEDADRAAERLARLGRGAIPALVSFIRAGPRWRCGHVGRMQERVAVAEALGLLRTTADVPLLTALLSEGHLELAWSLGDCRDPRVRRAFLDVIARGFADTAVMTALQRDPPDGATWLALRAWLRTPGRRRGGIGGFLGSQRSPDAVPFLLELLTTEDVALGDRLGAASALERLGRAEAMSYYLETAVAAAERLSAASPSARMEAGWLVTAAGDGIDGMIGERLFGAPRDREQCIASADRVRAWWTGNHARLAFDARRGVWCLGSPARSLWEPANGPVADAVREVIGDGCGRTEWRGWLAQGKDPRTRAIVALGRDALPAVVEEIRRAAPWEHVVAWRTSVAYDALRLLATEGDRAGMIELLTDGRLGVAPWFVEHPSPEGRDALVSVVRRGWLDGDMLRALRPFAQETVVLDALASWERRLGADDFKLASDVAEILEDAATAPEGPGQRDGHPR